MANVVGVSLHGNRIVGNPQAKDQCAFLYFPNQFEGVIESNFIFRVKAFAKPCQRRDLALAYSLFVICKRAGGYVGYSGGLINQKVWAIITDDVVRRNPLAGTVVMHVIYLDEPVSMVDSKP